MDNIDNKNNNDKTENPIENVTEDHSSIGIYIYKNFDIYFYNKYSFTNILLIINYLLLYYEKK